MTRTASRPRARSASIRSSSVESRSCSSSATAAVANGSVQAKIEPEGGKPETVTVDRVVLAVGIVGNVEDIGLEISDDRVVFPDGTTWDESEKTCGEGDDATPGQIVIARWNDAQAAADGERPSEITTSDFGDIRFRNDREYYTLAYVPEDDLEDIPVRPDVVSSLNNLSDVPPEENIDAPSTTATTVADADGSTTSTTAGDDPSTGSTSTTAAG